MSSEDRPAGGLRERKKARTRAVIAEEAARLFGRYGFAQVTMIEVARAAEVSEQTVYNYFPTKESLVFDRADALDDALRSIVAERDAGTDLVDAYATWLGFGALGDSARRSTRSGGGMPRLVPTDAGLRRHLLEQADRMAGSLAADLVEREGWDPVPARTLADALLQVFVRTIDALGTAKTDADLAAVTADAQRALETLRPAFAAVAGR